MLASPKNKKVRKGADRKETIQLKKVRALSVLTPRSSSNKISKGKR
jgi:hypothetical protein